MLEMAVDETSVVFLYRNSKKAYIKENSVTNNLVTPTPCALTQTQHTLPCEHVRTPTYMCTHGLTDIDTLKEEYNLHWLRITGSDTHIHVYINIYIHTEMDTYTDTYMYIHMYTHAHTLMYACTYIIYMYAYVCVHIYVYICLSGYV